MFAIVLLVANVAAVALGVYVASEYRRDPKLSALMNVRGLA